MIKYNLIKNRKPEFGNWEYIKEMHRINSVLLGNGPIMEADWEFWDYSEGDGIYVENYKKADQLRAYFKCPWPECGIRLCFIKPYDWQLHYECIIAMPKDIIQCRNCRKEFKMVEEAGVDYIFCIRN